MSHPPTAQGRDWQFVNRPLRRFGLMVVPLPTSPKMLREHANVSESFHPSRRGNTIRWMRRVADLMEASGNYEH